LLDSAWTDPVQSTMLWHTMHMADPVLSMTRKLPYWLLWGSWHEVHCTSLFWSSFTGPFPVGGLLSAPSVFARAATSAWSYKNEIGWSPLKSVPR